MKSLIPLFLFLLTIFSFPFQPLRAQAPIPNGGFEQWSGGAPVGWMVDNAGPYTLITQTSDAHSGSSALEGSVISVQGLGTLAPSAISGQSPVPGLPYTDRPNSFTGFYKFSPTGGDSAIISCLFMKQGTGIGAGFFTARTSISSYTAFSVPILWATGDAPDSMFVEMLVVGSNTHVGTVIDLDDLAFSNQGSAVAPADVTTFALNPSYPNPTSASASTEISYTLDAPGYTSLTVYNIAGNAVASPVHEVQSAGRHSATLDPQSLAPGTYFVLVEADGMTAMQKLVIAR